MGHLRNLKRERREIRDRLRPLTKLEIIRAAENLKDKHASRATRRKYFLAARKLHG
jgi:hypothetical protein